MQEYREQIYLLLRDYDNTKMTRSVMINPPNCSWSAESFISSYLRDLIESTHEFLKLLEEHTSKLKHVFVQRRRAARKSGTTKKSRKNKKKNSTGENAGIARCWSLDRRGHA